MTRWVVWRKQIKADVWVTHKTTTDPVHALELAHAVDETPGYESVITQEIVLRPRRKGWWSE